MNHAFGVKVVNQDSLASTPPILGMSKCAKMESGHPYPSKMKKNGRGKIPLWLVKSLASLGHWDCSHKMGECAACLP